MFESAVDFSVVAALAQTATPFYHTWRKFPASICRTVAPRVLFSLADAERLLDGQEEAKTMGQGNHEQRSLIRAKRLLFNARCAAAVTKDWIKLCQPERSYYRDYEPMRPSEIARFQHAFYCVWTVGVMGAAPHLQHKALAFLDKCGPRELCRLGEMASYATNYSPNKFTSVGLDFQDKVWRVGRDLVHDRWHKVASEGHHYRSIDEGPDLGFLAFFDETQKYLETIDNE